MSEDNEMFSFGISDDNEEGNDILPFGSSDNEEEESDALSFSSNDDDAAEHQDDKNEFDSVAKTSSPSYTHTSDDDIFADNIFDDEWLDLGHKPPISIQKNFQTYSTPLPVIDANDKSTENSYALRNNKTTIKSIDVRSVNTLFDLSSSSIPTSTPSLACRTFPVVAVDPGITDGAIVRYDACTRRLIDAQPYSLRDYSCTTIKELRKSRTPLSKNDEQVGSNVSPVTRGNVTISTIAMLGSERIAALFARDRNQIQPPPVFIEKQLGSTLLMSQCVIHTMFVERALLSDPRTIRTHYGIRVAGESLGAKKGLDARAYNKRKELSMRVGSQVIHQDDLGRLFDIASRYWQTRNISYKSKKARIAKCFNDLVEASLIALCPLNWKKAAQTIDMPLDACKQLLTLSTSQKFSKTAVHNEAVSTTRSFSLQDKKKRKRSKVSLTYPKPKTYRKY